MQFKPYAAIAILGSLLGLVSAGPAAAHPKGYGHAPHPVGAPHSSPHRAVTRHRMHRHHARMLPPEVPYRDPSVDLRPRGQPDFLIHAYMPRFTETPMYNEPPARFPQR